MPRYRIKTLKVLNRKDKDGKAVEDEELEGEEDD